MNKITISFFNDYLTPLMKKELEFPIYRKYSNNHAYFKVISKDFFEEVKKAPKGYSLHTFEVKILPDRNFINDLIANLELHWIEITEGEYEGVKKLVK